MNRRTKITLISAAAAIGLTAGAAALQAASNGGFEKARFGGMHHGGMHFVCNDGEERLEDFITFARIRLDIRDEQQTEWQAFADAVRSGGRDLLTACDSMDTLRTGAAPERLAEMETIMEKGLGALKGIRTAFDPLYATFDDEQKATVERLTHRRHHHFDEQDGDEERKG